MEKNIYCIKSIYGSIIQNVAFNNSTVYTIVNADSCARALSEEGTTRLTVSGAASVVLEDKTHW